MNAIFAVPKVHEMLKRQLRRARVSSAMLSRLSNSRCRKWRQPYLHALLTNGCHRDQPSTAAAAAIADTPDQIAPVPVADNKIKIPLLQKVVFNPGQDQRRVSIADLRHHHADRKTPLRAQRASMKFGR